MFVGGSAGQSNLQCFLSRTTPVVPSQLLPKACFRDLNRLWHPWDSETIEYFTLRDLWSCYDEWSAYGAGVPVSVSDHPESTLIQYYVPYLSAIQIYTSTSFFTNPRYFKEDAETSDPEMREFSDSCSFASESDRLWRSETGSSEHDCCFDQDGAWHFNDRLGHLQFQYFERSAPYGRIPLVDKINKMAEGFPGLMTLKSVDLSPASWMAVAWYPIYHIPKGKTVKDLSTSFLTYHTLSSSFQDINDQEETGATDMGLKETADTALYPFGLATYKMRGNLWVAGDNSRDQHRMLSLLSAADSWLRQLGVQHHDFSYFTGNRRG